MATNNFSKSVILFFILLVYPVLLSAQTILTLESEAVAFFDKNVSKIDRDIPNSKVIFPHITEEKNANVYELANIIGDIKLIKDSIPDKIYLDSLEFIYNNSAAVSKKILISKSIKKKYSKSINGQTYRLFVFNAINYRNNEYVELLLIDIKTNLNVIIFIKFCNGLPKDYFIQKMTYE